MAQREAPGGRSTTFFDRTSARAWSVVALGALLVACRSRRAEIEPTSLDSEGVVDARSDGPDADAQPPIEPHELVQRRCRPLGGACRVGKARRPSRRRGDFLSTDGLVIRYFKQTASFFDAKSLEYATVLDCPLHENVYAWDVADVYALYPESCGGENCGGDYTGYSWGGLGVVHPSAFRWRKGGYGADDLHVYHVEHDGPLEHASPARFQVLTCGGDRGFVLGREDDHFFRDGAERSESEAMKP
jgi:hypothetical protein